MFWSAYFWLRKPKMSGVWFECFLPSIIKQIFMLSKYTPGTKIMLNLQICHTEFRDEIPFTFWCYLSSPQGRNSLHSVRSIQGRLLITDLKGRQCFQKRVSFCPQGVGGWVDSPRQTPRQTPALGRPPLGRLPVLTSSGGHCSGPCASCWNAFLFKLRRLI